MDFYLRDGELKVINGELSLSDSEIQDMNILVEESKGNIRFNPNLGCDIKSLINGKFRSTKLDKKLIEQIKLGEIKNIDYDYNINNNGELDINFFQIK